MLPFPPDATPPLASIRVLDAARVLAGPFCGQLLADLGANVVKLERPGTGDDTRGWGPPYVPGFNDLSAYFLSCNRGKRSLTLDIADPDGNAVFHRLLAKSDVLIENFRSDSAEKLGLTPELLLSRHPRLVVCSISGFGRTGPLREAPGYDFAIQAMSGLMSITGPAEGPPCKVGVAVADVLTGLYAATAILACLHARDRSGHGYAIDLGLLDCALAAQVNVAQAYLTRGVVPQRQGNSHLQIVPYQLFETADGYLVLNVGNDSQWQAFCTAAGTAELGSDPRFAANRQRVEHREEVLPQRRRIDEVSSHGGMGAAVNRGERAPCRGARLRRYLRPSANSGTEHEADRARPGGKPRESGRRPAAHRRRSGSRADDAAAPGRANRRGAAQTGPQRRGTGEAEGEAGGVSNSPHLPPITPRGYTPRGLPERGFCMTPAVPSDPRLKLIYEMAEQRYLRSLPLEHFMEATPQATQRKITLESFDLVRVSRPDVHCFNELLVQYPRPEQDPDKPGQVVPDNMVVIHPEPIRAEGSFNLPFQPARPFLVLEYVSKRSVRKDYDANMLKYEHHLKVPYYLLFYPDADELSLFRMVDGKYVSVPPNDAGRHAIPELELEAALLNGWVRYWFRGELLPLPGDLLQQLTATRDQLVATQRALRAAEAEVARLREELAKAKGQS